MDETDLEKSDVSSEISDESEYLAVGGPEVHNSDIPCDDNDNDIEDSGGDYEKSSTLEVKEAVKLNISGIYIFHIFKIFTSFIFLYRRCKQN